LTTTTLLQDGNILWIPVVKVGNPDPWESGRDYKIGDVVVPRFPVVGQEDFMFQVVGFAGTSGSSEPVFPSTEFARVEDGGIVWRALRKDRDPPQLPVNEYYILSETTVVT
jgi:hypothetical protein